MGMSHSDECAEHVLAIVRLRYLVKLAVASAVCAMHHIQNIQLMSSSTSPLSPALAIFNDAPSVPIPTSLAQKPHECQELVKESFNT